MKTFDKLVSEMTCYRQMDRQKCFIANMKKGYNSSKIKKMKIVIILMYQAIFGTNIKKFDQAVSEIYKIPCLLPIRSFMVTRVVDFEFFLARLDCRGNSVNRQTRASQLHWDMPME